MELAAIASAAVPGLAPTGVAGAPDDAADFDSALLVDDAGKQWRVRSPRHAEASMRLETELQALRAFTPAIKAELPFLIPHMAGSVRQGELSTFVYSHLAGTTRPLDGLTAGGPMMAQELGRVIAAIHALPAEMVQRADLPGYEAEEYRQRKLNELDQAATTGKIPSILLRRWEHALEDVALWRFSPTVVHGDLHEDHLLVAAGRVSAVTGWTDLCVGDPAEDFAWLAAAEDTAFVDAVYAAYAAARATTVDPHLSRRAALAAEFALAQWLVRGVALDDAVMIDEAEDMLATLEADVESIEREQHEAAERARHEHEQRVEWGDDQGTDADGVHPSSGDHDAPHGGEPSTGDAALPPTTGVGTVDAGDADDVQDAGPDGSGGAVDGEPHAATTAHGRSPGHSGGPGGDAAAGPERTGSHVVDPKAAANRAHRRPAPTDDDDRRHDHGPSGSSLAHARLTAGRPRPATTSSKVTLLKGSEPGAGSPDDVATSALPIVQIRR
ncbi:aminoglycoside phosphotransferase (APT) family kinase protein [Arthrobacter sp. CAN_A2]|uniref:phosphotransferase n=1 Tax=Arthrobacter sp. CAN_A2 TaxID=2787718 RepID=UPI0018EFF89D